MNVSTFRMAVRNLSRNKKRNIATGVAITFGFAGLILLSGYIYRVQNLLKVYTVYGTRNGHVMVFKKEGLQRYPIKPKEFSLTAADVAVIKEVATSVEKVDAHGSRFVGTGLIGNGCKTRPFQAEGVPPEIEHYIKTHPLVLKWTSHLKGYARGDGIWNYDPSLSPIMLSEGLARLLNKKKVHSEVVESKAVVIPNCQDKNINEQLGADANVQLVTGSWQGMMSALDAEVVAQYTTGQAETNRTALIAPVEFLQKLYDTDHITYYSMWAKDYDSVQPVLKEVRQKLKDRGMDFDVYQWDDETLNPYYTGTIQFLITMVGFLVFVMSSVIVFSIFNSATITVLERSQEIGMLRSLGFTRRHIRILYVIEVLCLSLISLGIGGVLSVSSMLFINNAQISFQPPGVSGKLQLLLIPNSYMIGMAALLVILLAAAATWFAVNNVVQKICAQLLLGTHR